MFIKKKCRNLYRKPILVVNTKKVEPKKEEKVVIEVIEPVIPKKRSRKAVEPKVDVAETNNEKVNFEENEL